MFQPGDQSYGVVGFSPQKYTDPWFKSDDLSILLLNESLCFKDD
jgi:hypothetical protein